jgi:hypothetical protein
LEGGVHVFVESDGFPAALPRAGISSTSSPPCGWNALDFVLGALHARYPRAIEELRDATGNDTDVAATWSNDHYLGARWIVDCLVLQRRWWTKFPERAAGLSFGGFGHQVIGALPHADALLQIEYDGSPSLPDPHDETLDEWLQRAKALYADRTALGLQRSGRPARSQWAVFARHCDWFVQAQVLEFKITDVSISTRADRGVIERAVRRIADLLGVPRRKGPRGRPRKFAHVILNAPSRMHVQQLRTVPD